MSTPTSKSVAEMVASFRSCKCDPASGCSTAAAEVEIVSAVAALEAERDALRAMLQKHVDDPGYCAMDDEFRALLAEEEPK
jgi:hypothetical protein